MAPFDLLELLFRETDQNTFTRRILQLAHRISDLGENMGHDHWGLTLH